MKLNQSLGGIPACRRKRQGWPFIAAGFGLVALALMPGRSAAIPVEGVAVEQLTVRELMQLDAERALEAARRRREQTGKPGATVSATLLSGAGHETPRLVGIYGVGKRLFAEVRSGGRGYVFLSGHRLPVGYRAGDDIYRLKTLAGACIQLERKGEETELCLSRGTP